MAFSYAALYMVLLLHWWLRNALLGSRCCTNVILGYTSGPGGDIKWVEQGGIAFACGEVDIFLEFRAQFCPFPLKEMPSNWKEATRIAQEKPTLQGETREAQSI